MDQLSLDCPARPVFLSCFPSAHPVPIRGGDEQKISAAEMGGPEFPLLGEDNRYVFLELLGLTESDLSFYAERGIIVSPFYPKRSFRRESSSPPLGNRPLRPEQGSGL
jgi:hypothetical protein